MQTSTQPNDRALFTENDTMDHVLAAAPQARTVLMNFHIGGCHHCGFEVADTVGKVAEDNGIPARVLLAALNDA